MRAYEFIKENATAGATSAGNIATVTKPLVKDKKGKTFFGGDLDEFPKYGDTGAVVVIRRTSPTAKN